MIKHIYKCVFILLLIALTNNLYAQDDNTVVIGSDTRRIHYLPEGKDFKTTNGWKRFNRALYGGNSAFRAEAGDLPEFALYLPGMGGNLRFGLINDDKSKWLIKASTIEARYRPGSMLYKISDDMLGQGTLHFTALAMYEKEGLIIKVEAKNISGDVQLFAAFGGATGTRFSREGDIGADPESSFDLNPEYCSDNVYRIDQNKFTLLFGSKKPLTEEERYEIQYGPKKADSSIVPLKSISGIFPSGSHLKIADARSQHSPLQFFSSADSSNSPALVTRMGLQSDTVFYFMILNGKNENSYAYTDIPSLFAKANTSREEIAGRIDVNTPDRFINTLGGALSIAEDAIWEDPSYMHGAVAWRMRLNGWRGAYAADVLGLHGRARKHFDSYALSQLTSPLSAPVVMDTALNLARGLEKLGTSLFSSGYICRNPNGDFRPHHYDMNLVFIDQLLTHFLWTGDTNYVRKMWPLLIRHLDWEKRNFDVDGDGLYDAYAAIWASDALQYSGGGVTHSSSYNYRSYKLAADLAKMIGKDPKPFQQEADKIHTAVNKLLWMPEKGWYAEYKDLLGKKLLHSSAALWTVYHAMDSRVPNAFQSYQLMHYVDNEIPRIPAPVRGVYDSIQYTISTSNWQPYTWSLNNVVLAEVLHTSLAYWQSGQNEQAYTLWKSALVESMYQGASPGNIQQLSFHDAIRGELYRDFADDIGMMARSLVEGLFGIFPDVLHDTLYINPGFPAKWEHASIRTPDINFSFRRNQQTDSYQITPRFSKALNVLLRVKATNDDIQSVIVNELPVKWQFDETAVGSPVLRLQLVSADQYQIEIKWKGKAIEKPVIARAYAKGYPLTVISKLATFSAIYDPQKVLSQTAITPRQLKGIVQADKGNKTFFIRVKQGRVGYWLPVNFQAVPVIDINIGTVVSEQADNQEKEKNYTAFVQSRSGMSIKGTMLVNHLHKNPVSVPAMNFSNPVFLIGQLVPGTNRFSFDEGRNSNAVLFTDWDIKATGAEKYEKVDLSTYFNESVNNIFKNQYLSPRPKSSTLQLPTQGIGNWAYALVNPVISDSGLRKRAEHKNEIVIKQGIPFAIDPQPKRNIVFTSQWDNFPDSVIMPLRGKATHAYLLMAGSTNPMQSRMVNGEVEIRYKDGTTDKLELKNPENWWPIEQDYFVNGLAFTTDAPKPIRVYLKTGEDTRSFNNFTTIRGFSNRGIDGGAATVLDIPLNSGKEIKDLVLKAIANDVIIGLMSLTLVRP